MSCTHFRRRLAKGRAFGSACKQEMLMHQLALLAILQKWRRTCIYLCWHPPHHQHWSAWYCKRCTRLCCACCQTAVAHAGSSAERSSSSSPTQTLGYSSSVMLCAVHRLLACGLLSDLNEVQTEFTCNDTADTMHRYSCRGCIATVQHRATFQALSQLQSFMHHDSRGGIPPVQTAPGHPCRQ